MNIKELKEMINLMNENGLTELEVEKDGIRVRLKKASSAEQTNLLSPVIIEKQQIETKDTLVKQPVLSSKAAENLVEIRSPMVGTFYRAPGPEAPPFVEVGQVVEPGQVVCIIEAMKLMNEIKAEIKGKVVEVSVDNAEPVEFGQTLFLIEPL